jgi:hypothetical protein
VEYLDKGDRKMTLKDWKKIQRTIEGGYTFIKKGFGEITLSKGDVNRHSGYWKEDSKEGWSVSIDTKKNDIDNTFKTKSQALKFAKSYMRSH